MAVAHRGRRLGARPRRDPVPLNLASPAPAMHREQGEVSRLRIILGNAGESLFAHAA